MVRGSWFVIRDSCGLLSKELCKNSAGQERISSKTTLSLTPSDGRGNPDSESGQLPKRLDTPTGGGRFSLSHPLGEGRAFAVRAKERALQSAGVLVREGPVLRSSTAETERSLRSRLAAFYRGPSSHTAEGGGFEIWRARLCGAHVPAE